MGVAAFVILYMVLGRPFHFISVIMTHLDLEFAVHRVNGLSL